jgi:hypothetical protein
MGTPCASLLGTWASTDLVSPVFLLLDICWVSFDRRVARVPHPFPRFLREWVGDNATLFLPDQ